MLRSTSCQIGLKVRSLLYLDSGKDLNVLINRVESATTGTENVPTVGIIVPREVFG